MASKKPSKPAQRTANQSFRGFINYNLTDDDKKAVKAIEFTSDDVLNWLDKVVDSGFKITLSYDDYSHANLCVGTRSDRNHPDFGIMLSGRGSTPAKAFRQWLYIKDSVIGDDDWTAWLERSEVPEIDD